MQKEFGSESVVFNREKYNDQCAAPAAKYTRRDSALFKTIADSQVTVPRNKACCAGSHVVVNNCCYNGVLNEEGTKLLENTKRRAEKKEFKDTLGKYVVERRNSGYWHDTKTGTRYLNTFHNLYIDGYLSDGKRVDTSTIVLLDENAGWALTLSGSLYSLGSAKTEADRHAEEKEEDEKSEESASKKIKV